MTDNVISLAERKDAAQGRNDEAIITWASAKEKYATAKRTCDETGALDDGIAAGIAFSDFVDAARSAGRPMTDAHIQFPSMWNADELAAVSVARIRQSSRSAPEIEDQSDGAN